MNPYYLSSQIGFGRGHFGGGNDVPNEVPEYEKEYVPKFGNKFKPIDDPMKFFKHDPGFQNYVKSKGMEVWDFHFRKSSYQKQTVRDYFKSKNVPKPSSITFGSSSLNSKEQVRREIKLKELDQIYDNITREVSRLGSMITELKMMNWGI